MSLSARLPWRKRVHPVLRANRELFRDFDQSRPLETYEYVVLDTELTGLNRRRDEIVSIGAVRVVGLRIELARSFHTLVRPRRIRPSEATLVHRITPQELEQAPDPEEVLPAFVEFLGRSLVVGHFVDIDIHFLNKACKDYLGGTISNASIDTMRLARGYREAACMDPYRRCGHSGSYALEALTREFDLPRFQPHDALEDALQTAYLFLYLVKKMQPRGVRSLRDLYRSGRILGLMRA